MSADSFAAVHHDFHTEFDDQYEDKRRKYLNELMMAGAKRLCFPSTLPDEIWLSVVSYLPPRELLTSLVASNTTAEQVASKRSQDSAVSLSQDIYASYVVFDGVRYIREIRNASKETARDDEVLLLAASEADRTQSVLVAVNHFGVREVVFNPTADTAKGIDTTPEVWWRRIAIAGPETKLEAKSDVCFILLEDTLQFPYLTTS